MDNIKPYKYFRIFYRIPVIAGVFGFIIAIFLSQLVTFKEYQILKNYCHPTKSKSVVKSSLILKLRGIF